MKNKRMDQDRMNGVFIICSMLHVEEDFRYDVIGNNDYEYSLVLKDCSGDDNDIVKIDYCSPDDFCAKLLELRNQEDES